VFAGKFDVLMSKQFQKDSQQSRISGKKGMSAFSRALEKVAGA
jgi:hypothetical protein